MADVKVRKLDDWVVMALRDRAREAGRSLEEELRAVLTDKAIEAQHGFAQRARAVRDAIAEQRGTLSDSTALIREDRESRG